MPVIEKGVPVPRGRANGADAFGFEKMVSGDSFLLDRDVKPTTVVTSFAHFLARGRYHIRKEGETYRFWVA